MRVLVVVPAFPSLNQPWIDTYLESLLREGIDFLVFTAKTPDGSHQQKVDRLGFLERTARYSNERNEWLMDLGRMFLGSPLRVFTFLRLSAREVGTCDVSGVRKLKAILRCAHLAGLVHQQGHFDVFHGHFEDSSFEFLLVARILGYPMAMTFHGLPPKGVPQPAQWRRPYLYRHLARVFVNTIYARDAVVSLGCPGELVAVVPQGLPLQDFDFSPQPPPGDTDVLRIVTIGRFHRDKGHGRAILAARRLAEAGVRFRWVFIGVGPAEEIGRLQRYINRLGLGRSVHLLVAAPAEVLRAELAGAHLFVLSSLDQGPGVHVETQGVVVQEAQASGCIPIVTRVGGVPECVRAGVDALVIPPGSSRAISAAVRSLLERRTDWPDMLAAGRENVERRFSAEAIGKQMAANLREVLVTGTRTLQ